jgi:hypothetical protein
MTTKYLNISIEKDILICRKMAVRGTMTEAVRSTDKETELLRQLETLLASYKGRSDTSQPKIPLSLFSNRSLGVLEVLVKFLKENQNLTYSDIAQLLNRNDRTIWTTYKKAQKKHSQPFDAAGEKTVVPCTVFLDRSLGPLQALTLYTRDEMKFSFNEISQMLNRDYRTVWLSYQNGKRRCAHA